MQLQKNQSEKHMPWHSNTVQLGKEERRVGPSGESWVHGPTSKPKGNRVINSKIEKQSQGAVDESKTRKKD